MSDHLIDQIDLIDLIDLIAITLGTPPTVPSFLSSSSTLALSSGHEHTQQQRETTRRA